MLRHGKHQKEQNMSLKRYIAIICSLVMVFAFATSGFAAEKTYNLKIAYIEASGGPQEAAFKYLKQILEEKTKGQIKVTIYPGKSMAQSDPELGEIVRQNTVQLVPIPTHTLSAMVNIPQYSIFEFPYLFSSWDEIYKLLDSDLCKSWTKPLETGAGVIVYDGFVRGWLTIGTKKGPINTPADLKGLKIRTMATDMQMGLISSLGASPTVVAYGETYTAVQQGTVDGLLTATALYRSDKFAEVIDHLTIIRATAHFHLPAVNKAWRDSLTPELRKIFDECMKEYAAYGRELDRKTNEEVIASLGKDYNVQVRHYTDAELAPFKTATKAFWEKNYDRPGKGVVDEVLKFLGKDFNVIFK
jgi:tripartite ATP-independent transporter DctP family solute receptor